MGDERARLRPCPACEKMVSKWAATCPSCGCPLVRKMESKRGRRYEDGRTARNVCHVLACVVVVGDIAAVVCLTSLFPWGSDPRNLVVAVVAFCLGLLPAVVFWGLGSVLDLLLALEGRSRDAMEEERQVAALALGEAQSAPDQEL